ncbi:MAG TPA: carbohydrate ABC transporter permease [Aggregatilineales bacterium]|nr:carbohydrate ABC transporter permease [Aggregatilineales bacterium]
MTTTAVSAVPAIQERAKTRFGIPPAPRWAVHILLVLIGVLWLEPTVGLLITSFRPREDIASSGWWNFFLQPHFTIENYASVLAHQGMGSAFVNSFIITIPSVILPVFLAALAAYALAWIPFRGRRTIFTIVIALLVIPLQTTLVPVLQIFNGLHLTGTYIGLWLAHTGFGLPFAIYLLRNFFAGLPKELLESAKMDGATDWGVFLRIIIPVSVPALASLTIFQFMWVWNDLLVALTFSGPKTAPVTVAMQSLLGTYATEWDIMSSSAFISIAVPLIVFFALQRYFVTGITAGAVKE